jgi:predicted ATPase
MQRNVPEERRSKFIFSLDILTCACMSLIQPVSYLQYIQIASKLNFLAVANIPGLNVLKDSVKRLNESCILIRCEKQEMPSPLYGGRNVC